ncbi:hypothetical protein DV737_g614, partial [Chaetothyriales sp. CBS 132003]
MACADCFNGFERTDATPTGSETTLYGLPTYVADPPGGAESAKGIIVIIADIFGWQFVNNRLLADTYAAAGFSVYLPDFMEGRAAKIWVLEAMEKVLTPAKTWADTLAKPAAIGVAGFCWGGKHAISLTEKEYGHLIDASFTAHPSFLSLPGDIEKVRKPLAIALGSKDNMVSVKQAEDAEKTLIKLGDEFPDELKGKTEVKIYEGAGHGFSVRIDRVNKKQVEQANECEAQALSWFERFLT